jgi:hypothetical protein
LTRSRTFSCSPCTLPLTDEGPRSLKIARWPLGLPKGDSRRASADKSKRGAQASCLPLPLRLYVLRLSHFWLRAQLTSPPQELDVYLNAYRKGGFAAPLNWYRTRQINFREEQLANLPPFPPHIPCLQLPASHDAALPPSMALSPAVLRCFPAGNLDVRVLEGADHWCLHVGLRTTQERDQTLTSFLSLRF